MPDLSPVVKGRPQGDKLGALLSDLATQSSALVRDEVALVKQEIREKALSLRMIGAVLMTGALLGVFFVQMIFVAAFIALAGKIGWIESALYIGLGSGVISAAAICFGIWRLKQISPKPGRIVETLEEDKQWLRELTQ